MAINDILNTIGYMTTVIIGWVIGAGLFGALLCLLYGWYRFDQDQKETVWQAWRKLAHAQGLIFVKSSKVRRLNYVTGLYRGAHLKLEAERISSFDDLLTHIQLTVLDQEQPSQGLKETFPLGTPLSKDVVSRLLFSTNGRYLLERGKAALRIKQFGGEIAYQQRGLEKDIGYLTSIFDLMFNLSQGYQTILALGGDAVPALQYLAGSSSRFLRSIAVQLLKEIGQQSEGRFTQPMPQALCPKCLTRVKVYKIRPGSGGLIQYQYHGCRTCGQTREFLTGLVTAVLDQRLASERGRLIALEQPAQVRVAWLAGCDLFDFDRVEIVQATDEMVERFVVQAGNDTDDWRRKRYQALCVEVGPGCRLAPDTLRMLQRQFGEVVVGEVACGGS